MSDIPQVRTKKQLELVIAELGLDTSLKWLKWLAGNDLKNLIEDINEILECHLWQYLTPYKRAAIRAICAGTSAGNVKPRRKK